MGRMDTIDINGHPMRIYVAVPAGSGARPGVLVNHHGPGVDRFIQAQVDALAEAGYVAASPDLFHRQPDDGTDTMTKVSRLRDAEILEDSDAAIAYLASLADPKALAELGFCMGGRTTYLLAGARPECWRSACVFYGGNIFKAWGDGPTPFERTERIACPLLGIFGADDTNPSPDDVKRIDEELTRLGKQHTFHTYNGAGHAFLNFTNAERYRPDQARDACAKALAFLGLHRG